MVLAPSPSGSGRGVRVREPGRTALGTLTLTLSRRERGQNKPLRKHHMRIVHLDSHVPWRGGEQQVLYLTQCLHGQGHDSVVVCPPQSALYQRMQEANMPAVGLRMRHELDIVAAWQLGRYLRRQRVEILHMHTPHAHTIGLLASTLAPAVRLVVSRRVDFAPIRTWLSRWKYARAGVQYLAVSEAVRQVLIASSVPAQQVQTVHSGIDLRRFSAVSEAPPVFPAGTRVIGTVGHLARSKGQRYLLEAIALLVQEEPQVGVVLAGDGALRAELEALATALGITAHVCFTGFRRDILALMQGFEIFAFTSYHEGLGTAILDAMALGKPVIATRAGGIPEAVQNGITGLLVPPRSPQALADALHYLLRHPAQAKTMGMAGRRRVEQQFTMERMACHTLQVYKRILADAAA
jgi:glycosyltransferase involved in cell wall biosynthesis